MKAMWLREVRRLLESERFSQWWGRLHEMDRQRRQGADKISELQSQINLMAFRAEQTQKEAIDALYLAGEYEDKAARLRAEAAEIENKSYEAVANFENQRIMVSDIYSRMGAVEHNQLSLQAEVDALGKSLEQSRDAEQRAEMKRVLKRKQSDLAKANREFAEVSAHYERENKRKMSLWEEVEHLWGRSLDINLSVSEKRVKSKRSRQESERLFKRAEGFKDKVQQLKEELHSAGQQQGRLIESMGEHRSSARQLFACSVGEEFLYWPSREREKAVFCVPLGDYQEGFNIELKALNIYLADRQRGVEFLEPLPPDNEILSRDDTRIDDFFRMSRKQADLGRAGDN